MKRSTVAVFLVVCLLQSITGCGGGSGSGNGATNTPPPVTNPPPISNPGTTPDPGGGPGVGNEPRELPPPPVISYNGSTAPAFLTDDNVGLLAELVYSHMFGVLFLGDDTMGVVFPNPDYDIADFAVPGPQGGIATVSAQAGDGDYAWFMIEYDDFRINNTRRTGMVVIETLFLNEQRRITFHNDHIQSDRKDVVLNGVFEIDRPIVTSAFIAPISMTGMWTLLDNTSNSQIYAESYSIQREPRSNGYVLTGTSRIHHSDHGWLDYAIDHPITFIGDSPFPYYGGPVIAHNDLGQQMRLVLLDGEHLSLQYSSDTSGTLDRAARLQWQWRFDWQTRRPAQGVPVADAGPNLFVGTDEEILLDPAYSSHPATRLLSHQWRVLYRPPGSSAEPDDPLAVSPAMHFDVAGRYLLELEVSDGQATDTSVVAIAAVPGIYDYALEPRQRAQLVRGQVGSVGGYVSIDLRRHGPRLHANGHGDDWYVPPPVMVRSPHNNQFVATALTDESVSFYAEHRGLYQVLIGVQPGGSGWPLDIQPVAVDAEIPFLPAAWQQIDSQPVELSVADLNGDGIDDFVIVINRPTNERYIQIIYNAPFGEAAEQIELDAPAHQAAIGDLNSNGRPDIAVGLFGEIRIYSQDEAGQFSHTATLDPAPYSPTGKLLITDLNGNGRNDLFLQQVSQNRISYALQQPDGTLSAVQTVDTVASNFNDIAVGDLNNDGIPDLVFVSLRGFEDGGSVAVMYGPDYTDPNNLVVLPYSGTGNNLPRVAIGDLIGDGRNELVLGVSDQLDHTTAHEAHIYIQDEHGALVPGAMLATNDFVTHLLIGDFNHDGVPDLLQQGSGLSGFGLHLGLGDGTFAPVAGLDMGFYRAPAAVPLAGDFNGDGLVDIAYVTQMIHDGLVVTLFGTTP